MSGRARAGLSVENQGKYVFQGKSKVYNAKDRSGWTDEVQFAATGELYDKLCAVDADGSCTFPSTVTLAEDLTCDGAQCDVHTPRRRGRGRRANILLQVGAERLCGPSCRE